MIDIIERLRLRTIPYGSLALMDEAAVEIERLRNHNDQLLGYTKGMEDEAERLRAEIAVVVRERENWNGKHQEACIEIERLEAENIALIETLKQPDQVGYWQRKYEIAADEGERLEAEIEHLHNVIAEYGDICAAQQGS